jgi:hypothetical protein
MWVDNIKMDLVEIGLASVYWIGLFQDRDKWTALVKAAMNLRVLQNAGKLSSGYTTGGRPSTAQVLMVN